MCTSEKKKAERFNNFQESPDPGLFTDGQASFTLKTSALFSDLYATSCEIYAAYSLALISRLLDWILPFRLYFLKERMGR